MKVSDLTIEQFQALLRSSLEDAIAAMIDPDRGLELTDEFRERLVRATDANDPGLPIAEAAKRLGLEW